MSVKITHGRTYSAKPADVKRVWYVLDASDTTLGRLCTEVAQLLIGKKKPMFTHHIDCGDYVVITNADKLVVTGKKLDDKIYYSHTGYPGGLKERTLQEQMNIDSTKAIEKAVRGMLPVNKLRSERLKRLKVYAGTEHNHTAQTPTPISLKKKGSK
jgi:large subunit ribosomal protein L13